ncbi:MAG: hypothetical protein ACHBN1_18625 [Heteroscytonema crispum UTEX LB 1556]
MTLPETVWQRFHGAKAFVNESVNSLTNSAQQVRESLQETATQTTHKAIDTVTTTFGQAKNSLEQTLETAGQFQNTTSTAIQSAIASSISDWLIQHPSMLRMVQIFAWATSHPIIGLVILLFAVAIVWSIIKAIVRLIETASLSIVRTPFKLVWAFLQVIFLSLTKFGVSAIAQFSNARIDQENLPALLPATPQLYQDKQQRLTEIASRLEAIQKEQNELLQEAAQLLASDTIDVEKHQVQLNS